MAPPGESGDGSLRFRPEYKDIPEGGHVWSAFSALRRSGKIGTLDAATPNTPLGLVRKTKDDVFMADRSFG